MKKNYLILLLLSIFLNPLFSQQIGDPGWVLDQSKFDSKYPKQKRFIEAGVEGGIPLRASLPIKKTISPGDNLQNAINDVSSMGGGVLLLRPGTYDITSETSLKRGVVIRGTNNTNTIISVKMRSTSDKIAMKLDGIENAGLEDLKFIFPVSETEPQDDRNNPTNKHCSKCHDNDPGGVKNLYIKYVRMNGSTKNCWIDNCSFTDSGTDPIEVMGRHNTIRGSVIDGCFNKGGGGNCYLDVRGDDNLFADLIVKRIRHFAIQNGAAFNVVINSKLINTDINFHNGDDGDNLIEGNDIFIQRWRSWGAFATGGAPWGHEKPGPNNIIYNNTTDVDGKKGDYSGSDRIYTYKGYGDPSLLTSTPPSGRTFYPVKRDACVAGLPCDDGDVCTTGEVTDDECNCVGGTIVDDSDNDGFCDTIDQCPDFDDKLIGTPCDDGDLCTLNDVYTSNCKCEGVTDNKISISAIEDAYLQGGNGNNNNVLRLENNSRVAYIKYDLSKITENIEEVNLVLTTKTDPGSGIINVYLSNNTNWTENNISSANAPDSSDLIGSINSSYDENKSYPIKLTGVSTNAPFTLILKQAAGGNDVAFASSEFNDVNSRPVLSVSLETCSLSTSNPIINDQLAFYPNPVKDQLTINYKGNASDIEINIFDTMGKKIIETSTKTNTVNLDLSNIASGMYLVSVTDKLTGSTGFKKLIKK